PITLSHRREGDGDVIYTGGPTHPVASGGTASDGENYSLPELIHWCPTGWPRRRCTGLHPTFSTARLTHPCRHGLQCSAGFAVVRPANVPGPSRSMHGAWPDNRCLPQRA